MFWLANKKTDNVSLNCRWFTWKQRCFTESLHVIGWTRPGTVKIALAWAYYRRTWKTKEWAGRNGLFRMVKFKFLETFKQNCLCVLLLSCYTLLAFTSHINCNAAHWPDNRCLSHVMYLYRVIMTLHVLNDVVNDVESTQKSTITSWSLVWWVNQLVIW